jgi:hypothetical protein
VEELYRVKELRPREWANQRQGIRGKDRANRESSSRIQRRGWVEIRGRMKRKTALYGAKTQSNITTIIIAVKTSNLTK